MGEFMAIQQHSDPFPKNQEAYRSMFHHLHGGVVHNHAVKCDVRVTRGHFSATLQEQAITELPVGAERPHSTFARPRRPESFYMMHFQQRNSHDVGLMHGSDPATTFLPGQFEGVFSNPEGIVPGDDLETLHYT